ncbi:MAG: hypothetical protein DRQ43_00640 [Gammaproteobacteria bacterium]|nr:MAG: hypothetical protein DRQ43_00640 [Gammaproteobacteria bacterium]
MTVKTASFLCIPQIIGDDEKHSQNEKRYFTLGQTDNTRLLFIVSTIREN